MTEVAYIYITMGSIPSKHDRKTQQYAYENLPINEKWIKKTRVAAVDKKQ